MASAKLTASPRHIQVSLLAKVLEQENPIITSKMLPFLMQEGVAEVLINFITRLDPSSLPQNDDEAVRAKRANTAVALFEKASPPIISFLEKRADDVVASLFNALQHLNPDASTVQETAPGTPNGRRTKPVFTEDILDLWRRTLLAVLTLSPVQALEGATSDHSYMTGAVRVLDYTIVAQAVQQIYASAASQPSLGRKMTWFTWLLSRQLFSDIPKISNACGEMLLFLIYTYSGSLKTVISIQDDLAGQAQPHSVHAFLQPFQSTEFLESVSKGIGKGGAVGTLTELEGSWPSKICANSPTLVPLVSQLENKSFLNEVDNKSISTSPADVNHTNNTSPSKNAAKKKKKRKNSTTGMPEDVKQGNTPPTSPKPTSKLATSTNLAASKELDKLQALKISGDSTRNNNNNSDKMSVARCGVVKILATLADLRVNGVWVTLDALSADPHAWQVMGSWFMRFPYAILLASEISYYEQALAMSKEDICGEQVFDHHRASLPVSRSLWCERLMCGELLDLYNEIMTNTNPTPAPTDQLSRQKATKKKDSAPNLATLNQQTNFISYLDLHEEWRKMAPLLKVEVTWATPPPERPVGGGGGGGGITGFERDNVEEVLLDMPTNKFKNLAK